MASRTETNPAETVKKSAKGVAKNATPRGAAAEGEAATKAPAKKTAARRKTAPVSGSGNAVQLTQEERNRYVSEAAYFIAERRGFTAGSDVEDWLQAEAEIDQMLAGTTRH